MACGGAKVFERAYSAAIKLSRRRGKRGEFYCVDTSFVKNVFGRDCVGKNPTDRGRKATKVSAILDETGIPIALSFFPANVHDSKTLMPTIRARVTGPHVRKPLYADKGYDSRALRHEVVQAGFTDRFSRRRENTHIVVNRRRNVVERFFAWLDKSRRLIMRFDQKIHVYISWTWLACLNILTRRLMA